jgi:CubicO group peptidase (beta-lactamase class C family)
MFRILKYTIALLLALIVGGVLFLAAIRESIPDLYTSEHRVSTKDSSVFAEAIGTSQSRFLKTRSDNFYPSLSVSVFRNGENLWAESIGYADLKNLTLADGDTLYPIGSISKTLTAAATMKLVENGVIDLDTPISTYTSKLPAHYNDITLRQLLSHQAGVRHYEFAFTPPAFTENALNKEFKTVEEGLSIFIEDPLLFSADTSFRYSTFGYSLVAFVLEQATEKPFLQLMDETLFRPLSLNNTEADQKSQPNERRTKDYMSFLRRLGVTPSPPTNSSYKWAGGGFLSTPTDLARFGDALLRMDYLDQDVFDTMTRPRKLKNGELNPQQYALGWRIGGMTYPRDTENIVAIIHHGGTAAGSECGLLLTPDFGISVAVCGNSFTGGSGDLITLAAGIARDFQESVEKNSAEVR